MMYDLSGHVWGHENIIFCMFQAWNAWCKKDMSNDNNGFSKFLLVFVHWVDENWPTRFIPQNALEDSLIEVSNL